MCTIVDEWENCCRINSHHCCLREKVSDRAICLVWGQSFLVMPSVAVKTHTSSLFSCLVWDTISSGVSVRNLKLLVERASLLHHLCTGTLSRCQFILLLFCNLGYQTALIIRYIHKCQNLSFFGLVIQNSNSNPGGWKSSGCNSF